MVVAPTFWEGKKVQDGTYDVNNSNLADSILSDENSVNLLF